MKAVRLSELKKGDCGRVVNFSVSGSAHRRLMDMGVVSGSEIQVEGVAPLGDPVEIRVKGYNLTLRKNEAACITVEVG